MPSASDEARQKALHDVLCALAVLYGNDGELVIPRDVLMESRGDLLVWTDVDDFATHIKVHAPRPALRVVE